MFSTRQSNSKRNKDLGVKPTLMQNMTASQQRLIPDSGSLIPVLSVKVIPGESVIWLFFKINNIE